MTNPNSTTATPRPKGDAGPRRGRLARGPVIGALGAVLVIAALYSVYTTQNGPDHATTSSASGYKHAVGEPGPGDVAPDFTLPSSEGGTLSLSALRGQSVLLYFQEGLMCQPCFDQITDLEDNAKQLRDAGIDRVVSISSDRTEHLALKSSDMGLSTPVLADPELEVIRAYDANSYGMMGGSHAGHSFLLVDPEGTIAWRADYGGAPDYTMFLPTEAMLSDLTAERTS